MVFRRTVIVITTVFFFEFAYGSQDLVIDAHNHLPRGVSVNELVSLMDEAGVAMTVLMPVFYGASDPNGQGIADENLVLDFYRQQPDRIIPFVGMQRPVLNNVNRWLQPDQPAINLLRFTEDQLRTGLFRGMGEFIVRHYPYSLRDGEAIGGEVKIPADTPLMRQFLDLAVAYDVPVTIHYEVDSESLASLLSMLEYGYGRKAKIILAHNCGRPDPETLRALLDSYPNVYCDLGGMTPAGFYGTLTPRGGQQPKNPLDDGGGHLRPEWRALFEQYPDRFVGIGTDLAHPDAWDNRSFYTNQISMFRGWLADLTPETAQHIAFRNGRNIACSTAEKPAAPAFNGSLTGSTLDLSWNAVVGATGYRLYYAPAATLSPVGSVDMGGATSLVIDVTPLGFPPGARYTGWVVAYNGSCFDSLNKRSNTVTVTFP